MPTRWPSRILLFASFAALAAGCESKPPANPSPVNMFVPTGMRIHPIFTQIESDRNGKPTGIEAQLEFQDQFGDPTKASGRVLFELYSYRQDSPDTRGQRVGGPWVGSLSTLDEQHDRWNTTLRTYRFELTDPSLHTDEPYVLTAIFELTGGGRFFDRSILPGFKSEANQQEHAGAGFFPSNQPANDAKHSTTPATQP